jgi:hypothetical protein
MPETHQMNNIRPPAARIRALLRHRWTYWIAPLVMLLCLLGILELLTRDTVLPPIIYGLF